jgi:hypothetical protein
VLGLLWDIGQVPLRNLDWLPFTPALWSPSPVLQNVRLYQSVLIQCPCGRVAISDSDGRASSTQVPIVMCMWVPVVMSCHAIH